MEMTTVIINACDPIIEPVIVLRRSRARLVGYDTWARPSA